MKVLLLFLALCSLSLQSQNLVSDYEKVADQMTDLKTLAKSGGDTSVPMRFAALLDLMSDQLDKSQALNASGSFGFSGNETETSNLYKVSAGVGIDNGSYPYQFDFSTSVETLLKNGIFEESVADIDISFDFHPLPPKPGKDGLWLESFVFLSRFSDDYLGIEQAYEAGFGLSFTNVSRKLTLNGMSVQKRLDAGAALIPKYQLAAAGGDLPDLDARDAQTVTDMQARLHSANRKTKTKIRLGVLLGIFYELEKAHARNLLHLSSGDTTILMAFPATNKLRWEVRPTIKWKPSDNMTFRLYPYFKMAMPWDWVSTVNPITGPADQRVDYFVDLQSSWTANITEHFSLGLKYQLWYDNAPVRAFILDAGSPVLLMGPRTHHSYSLQLEFSL